ncbi:hypothetical protein ElyMa_005437500 [Elysia marginata]|uniref:Uncharacterized protein n=1 Tax=Elysia marginata TaxID=1093978 RepID=A0AAV4EMC0_9GAST|nr:hypothetical protein ElyMa_005437500 [Elysia marginata]
MGILRTSTAALRSLTHKDKHHGPQNGRRMLAQLSQSMLKVGQPTVSRRVQKDTVMNFLLPATIALLGLSVSTFCTHQLVATSDSKKLAFSATSGKDSLVANANANTSPKKNP